MYDAFKSGPLTDLRLDTHYRQQIGICGAPSAPHICCGSEVVTEARGRVEERRDGRNASFNGANVKWVVVIIGINLLFLYCLAAATGGWDGSVSIIVVIFVAGLSDFDIIS